MHERSSTPKMSSLSGPGSRELAERLRYGKDSARAQQRYGVDSLYVQHVRGYVADCPDSGSQQHRLRHQDENWLVSQFRWINEQRARGTGYQQIRRVLQACVDELDVMEEYEKVVGTISPDTFLEVAREETATEMYENLATDDALHRRDVSSYRAVVDKCSAQITALRRKMRTAGALAAKLTHRSA